MNKVFKISLAVASEELSPFSPVIFRGDIYEIIDKAKTLGYDGIELQLRDPEKIDPDKIRDCCISAGMGVSAVATGLEYTMNGYSMIDDDPGRRAEIRRRLFKDIEIAGKLNCPVIIGCVRGNIPHKDVHDKKEMYIQRFRDEMCMLSDEASKYGVTLVLEAINFYVNNYLNTIRQTCDFIDSLGRDNIKLHIDTHHMVIEEYDVIGSLKYAGDRIGYVHFTENNRMYPGSGCVDFWSIMQILQSMGYDGYISLEIIPLPDGDTCARKGIEYINKLCGLLEFRPQNMV